MGFFSSLFSSNQKGPSNRSSSGGRSASNYQKMLQEQKYQDQLLQRVNTARERYDRDGNVDAAIREYEYAFVTAAPPCISSQCTKLVDLYMKAGKTDSAWSYLNLLSSRKGVHKDWVRLYQAKILKKEEKDKDSIDLYMRGHLLKAKSYGSFTRSTFLRDISGPARRLGLSKDDKEQLANIVDGQIRRGIFTEQAIRQKYKEFLKMKGI